MHDSASNSRQRSELSAGRFVDVRWVDQTGSTNADLLQIAPGSPAVARVLFADEQTNGRGRLDRSWEQASGGGLMVSFFVPWSNAATAHLVPTALGVAIVGAAEASGRSVGLKWPNDVVIPAGAAEDDSVGELVGKKVGGMLSSSVVTNNVFRGVVAGLGCNISWPPPDFAELPEAAALDHLPGPPVDREVLAADLVSGFDRELTTIEERGPVELLDRYRHRCVTIGQRVSVEQGAERIVGRATDIDESGALLLEVEGRQRRIDVGDVKHLRPAE